MVRTLPLLSICSDVATNHCPCVATITKDCPICSLLDHGQKCACNQTWAGLCIYEKYLQQGFKQTSISQDKIAVIQNFILDNHLKLICHVPTEKIAALKPFQAVSVLTNNYKHPLNLFGVITKIIKEKNLVTIVVKDTNNEVPIRFGPILHKGTNVELKILGKILPPLLVENMGKILITVDNFWLSIISPLIDTLKNAEKEVVIAGQMSTKIAGQILITLVDKVLLVEKFSSLAEEIRNPHYDTLISMNTPLWQRKIVSLLWNEKVNKSLITVNNQWL